MSDRLCRWYHEVTGVRQAGDETSRDEAFSSSLATLKMHEADGQEVFVLQGILIFDLVQLI
jgi:hypothetical protein